MKLYDNLMPDSQLDATHARGVTPRQNGRQLLPDKSVKLKSQENDREKLSSEIEELSCDNEGGNVGSDLRGERDGEERKCEEEESVSSDCLSPSSHDMDEVPPVDELSTPPPLSRTKLSRGVSFR